MIDCTQQQAGVVVVVCFEMIFARLAVDTVRS